VAAAIIGAATGAGSAARSTVGATGSADTSGTGAVATRAVRREPATVRGFFFGVADRSAGRSDVGADAAVGGSGSVGVGSAAGVAPEAGSGVELSEVAEPSEVLELSEVPELESAWLVSDPPVSGSAHTGAGTAIAEPMPRATASAPTRPTWRAQPVVLESLTTHASIPTPVN